MMNRFLIFLLIAMSFASPLSAQLSSGLIQDPQRVALLLKNSSSSPTVDEVITSFSNASIQDLITLPQDPIGVTSLLDDTLFPGATAIRDAYPASALSRLLNYLIFEFQMPLSANDLANISSMNQHVESAYFIDATIEVHSSTLQNMSSTVLSNSWNLDLINAFAASTLVGSGSRIAFSDSGIEGNHPGLAAISSSGAILGGGYISSLSTDYSRYPEELTVPPFPPTEVPCLIVDEGARWVAHAGTLGRGPCDGSIGGMPEFKGHGTHVAGIAAANGDFSGITGVCPDCSALISKAWNSISLNVFVEVNGASASQFHLQEAISGSMWRGATTVNMSVGVSLRELDGSVVPDPLGFCQAPQFGNHPWCLVIEASTELGVTLVASAGNRREELQFPAADPRVIAVGGVDDLGNFWDESPGSITNCPLYVPGDPTPDVRECGSNFSYQNDPAGLGKTDVVAPAKNVISLFYTGDNVREDIGCEESFLGAGRGPCTGTSMAAPHVTGLAGLLRAVNPLLGLGDQDPLSIHTGVRSIINRSSNEFQSGFGHSPTLGYGIPNSELALHLILGESNSSQLLNRLTPMFSQMAPSAADHHYTISPQIAQKYLLFEDIDSHSVGSPVEGYPLFPFWAHPSNAIDSAKLPRADFFVFTTRNNPFGSAPLTRLIRLNRANRVNPQDRDFMLALESEALWNADYEFEGFEGFLLPLCSPEPDCIPAGAEKVLRRYNGDEEDHAVFLESNLQDMIDDGYSDILPGTNGELGYAFPNIHSDEDTLIDGMEIFIGTSPFLEDSNCDGTDDNQHYSIAGVPASDPMSGPGCTADLEVLALSFAGFLAAQVKNLGPDASDQAVLKLEFTNFENLMSWWVDEHSAPGCVLTSSSNGCPLQSVGSCKVGFDCVPSPNLDVNEDYTVSFTVHGSMNSTFGDNILLEAEVLPSGSVTDPDMSNNQTTQTHSSTVP